MLSLGKYFFSFDETTVKIYQIKRKGVDRPKEMIWNPFPKTWKTINVVTETFRQLRF
jgi:hypothetical protein